MKSIVCLETVAAFVLYFCLICAESIVVGPNDTSVILGGTVNLECFTKDKSYPPAWSYLKAGSGEKKDISLIIPDGDRIVPKLVDGYAIRHSIAADRSTGEYSLQITNAKPEDAGTYTCTARGGLSSAEKRSAELSIFEPFPVCASNNTDVVGENDCNKEPDVIEFSCKFQVHGNYLPKITWTVVNHPEEELKFGSPSKDPTGTGMVSSKLIIRGDHVGLDTTRFRCMVASIENADDNRTCVTPEIKVRKITSVMKSKALVLEAPEEVECKGWSQFNASGCEWLRRDYDGNGQQQETHVTSRSLLNLHKQDMKPGTYICVANCSIRGELCRVKLHYVSYKLAATVLPVSEQSNIAYVVVPVAVVVVIIAIGVVLFVIWKRSKNRRETVMQLETLSTRCNGFPNQYDSLLHQDSQNGVSDTVNVPGVKFEGPTSTPLVESDSGNDSSSLPSQKSSSSSEDMPNHTAYDIPDAKSGGIKNTDRARLAEEKALARMRANAARKGEEKMPLISADDDVAEGVEADKKKHE